MYGWVDTPRPRSAGPGLEFTLAPSIDQAKVTALLRDRALRDPETDRWQLDLDSDHIRGALWPLPTGSRPVGTRPRWWASSSRTSSVART